MSEPKTIAINGIQYDAHSGMPIEAETTVQNELLRVQSVHAKGVHQAQQRSSTLSRQFVKKSVAPVKQAAKSPAQGGQRMDITRSPHISKFARDPQPVRQRRGVSSDIGPTRHHATTKAHAAMHPVAAHAHQPRPAQEIKHAAISEALAKAQPAKDHKPKTHRKLLNVASASLGLLLIAGYFTYVNMPSLSVRVAAAQAGIDASYPEYRPIGYRLNGPVAYRDGEVTMQFASNSGPQQFALAQGKSSWDSTALLENYVNPRSQGRYATYSDAGLTVYTYGNNAAWVNGGILYTVEGSAALSNEQVRRIATSL